MSSQLKLADLIGLSCCRGCLEVFVGVVEVAGRALQPFLPFPKQILSCFDICLSTHLPILFFLSRRLAQNLQAVFVRKKKSKLCEFCKSNFGL